MVKLIKLFFTFFKLGATNFGGGYALLPMLEKEIVEKRQWATRDEVQDYYAVGQCTPGVISVNVSTFIGFKQKGVLGGIVATLGFIFPAFLFIVAIATILTNFMDNEYVQHAFNGITICVCVLIFKTVVTMLKKNIKDTYTLLMYFAVLFLSLFDILPAIILVLICGVVGILINVLIVRGKEA
ncbi:MAG: chromate transporter [bacterium]